MGVYREDLIDIELESGTINRSFLNHAIGKGDSMGNRFGMRLFRNGEPVDLTDAVCEGFFINPRGEHILINGTNAYTGGNVAFVQLPQACYNYEGSFQLTIKVVDPDVVESARIVDGTIVNTGVDNALAPVGAVPTYQEILALYEQMKNFLSDGGVQLRFGSSGDTPLEWDTDTTLTFETPFPNACVMVMAMPWDGFNLLSTLSVVSFTKNGVTLKQRNEDAVDMPVMNVRYVAFGY